MQDSMASSAQVSARLWPLETAQLQHRGSSGVALCQALPTPAASEHWNLERALPAPLAGEPPMALAREGARRGQLRLGQGSQRKYKPGIRGPGVGYAAVREAGTTGNLKNGCMCLQDPVLGL